MRAPQPGVMQRSAIFHRLSPKKRKLQVVATLLCQIYIILLLENFYNYINKENYIAVVIHNQTCSSFIGPADSEKITTRPKKNKNGQVAKFSGFSDDQMDCLSSEVESWTRSAKPSGRCGRSFFFKTVPTSFTSN